MSTPNSASARAISTDWVASNRTPGAWHPSRSVASITRTGLMLFTPPPRGARRLGTCFLEDIDATVMTCQRSVRHSPLGDHEPDAESVPPEESPHAPGGVTVVHWLNYRVRWTAVASRFVARSTILSQRPSEEACWPKPRVNELGQLDSESLRQGRFDKKVDDVTPALAQHSPDLANGRLPIKEMVHYSDPGYNIEEVIGVRQLFRDPLAQCHHTYKSDGRFDGLP